jgi:hypothetical protein
MPELQPARGFTFRAFLVGLLLVLLWLVYDCTLAIIAPLHAIEVLYLIGFGAVFTMFAVQMANGLLPESRRLSVHELTIVYTMVAVAIPWGIVIRGALEAPMKLLVVYTSPVDKSRGWLTPLWATKNPDAILDFRRGGLMPWQIQWSEWLRPILYWSLFLASFQAFCIFLVLFFRRLFIDEEKLPFPLATLGQSIVEYRPSKLEDASARTLSAAVKIAFVVGLLVCMPGIFSVTPDNPGSIPMNSAYYGTRVAPIPGLSLTISWDPFILCFLMFFPLDVLLTVTVVYVGVSVAFPMLIYGLGIPLPKEDYEGLLTNICGVGGLVGLAFWTLFFNRSSIIGYLREAFRGGRKAGSNDPLGYRAVVIGMVASFAAFVVLMVLGLGDLRGDLLRHAISIAITLFIIVTLVFAVMRQSGEQGWHYHSPWSVAKVIAYMHNNYMKDPTPLFRTQGSFLTISDALQFGAYQNTFAPHLHVLDSLKVASQTGTRTRDVMKAALVTLVVSLALVVPGYIMVVHYYGFDHGDAPNAWWNCYNYSQPQHGIGYVAIPTIFDKFAPWVSVPLGVAIIGFVMYMKREYLWFPFSAVGAVIAAGLSFFGHYSTSSIWFPIIIVLVVKRVIYRWFGVKFFRERVVPVVLFAMMGLMTGMFIYKMIFAAMGKGFLQPY